MKNLASYVILVGATALFHPQTQAITLPKPVQDTLPALQPLGSAKLTVWGFDVYKARLWANAEFEATDFAGHPFALELNYLRDFSSEAIATRSLAEMRRQGLTNDAKATAWQQQLREALPNVKLGDRVTGVNVPSTGALFFANGKPSGEIRDPEFARLFFGIWLAPNTSEPKLRLALLAQPPRK